MKYEQTPYGVYNYATRDEALCFKIGFEKAQEMSNDLDRFRIELRTLNYPGNTFQGATEVRVLRILK